MADGPWVDELPLAWCGHMNRQLSILGSKSQFRSRPKARAGSHGGSQSVPLDQGSVNGVLQHTDDEDVRRQVREQGETSIVELALCGASFDVKAFFLAS